MISIKCRMTQCSMFFMLVCLTNNIFAANYVNSFKEFILGVDEQNSQIVQNPMAKLPSMGRSAKCMICHDGTKAAGVRLKHADAPMEFTGHGSVNHPVGMNYNNHVNNSPVEFVSIERLDNRIILEDGEVTCISCHALKNALSDQSDNYIRTSGISTEEYVPEDCTANKKNLTTGSNITALCLSCHAM